MTKHGMVRPHLSQQKRIVILISFHSDRSENNNIENSAILFQIEGEDLCPKKKNPMIHTNFSFEYHNNKNVIDPENNQTSLALVKSLTWHKRLNLSWLSS